MKHMDNLRQGYGPDTNWHFDCLRLGATATAGAAEDSPKKEPGVLMLARTAALRRCQTIGLCVFIAGAPATVVVAAPDDAALEEVIVTAQKRAENIQDVPIAISAFSAEALQARGATNVADISAFTPNVQIDRSSPFAGSSTILSAYVRGIGQNDFAFNMEPGVGLYVDGVYYARTVGAAVDLLDVDHVEVLKGPQGTLFGRNTIGGAIHIVTRKPGREAGFQAELTAGDYDRQGVRVAADMPIVDGLAYASVSGSLLQRDGYQKRIPFDLANNTVVNPITGASYAGSSYGNDNAGFVRAKGGFSGSDTQGGVNSRTARAKLLLTPGGGVEILLSADLTNAREEATPMSLLKTYLSPGSLFGLVYNSCVGGLDPSIVTAGGLPPGMCNVPRGTVGTSLASVAPNRLPYGSHFLTGNIDTTYANGSNFSDVRTWGLGGTLDWKLNEKFSLRSITAYRSLDSKFGQDDDGAPDAFIDTSFTMDQQQFSEELQLNGSTFSDRLKSVLGAYYFTEKGGLLDTVTFASGLLQVYGPNDFKNDAWALFTHNNLKITDRLGATLGLRYTSETKYFTGGQSDLNNFVNAFLQVPAVVFPDPSNTQLLFPKGQNKRDFSNTSARAGLEYHFAPDVMGYASFAQGYKSGGWTTRLAVPLLVSAGAGAPIDPTKPPAFDPEKANTYELGLKSELAGHRVRLNVAAFRTDYQDMQIVAAPAFSFGAPWFFNAGEARIQGLEAEADLKAGAGLVFNASVGYLDAHYTKLGAVALAGGIDQQDLLVNVPKWSGTVGATYSVATGMNRSLGLHVDYSYKSNMARDASNTPELMTGAFGLLGANVNWGAADGHWQLFLAGENIGNKRYILSGNNNEGVGAIAATFNGPRMWYFGVRVRG